jgi:ABC-type branched-subunit amino acid transport system ATPase component
MSESLLQMRDVRSGYEDMEILKGVTMDIFPSGITCMIGPNGAGKSTVLRTVYGILRLRGGQISFEGERIDGKKPLEVIKRGICYVPQGRSIFPLMTVMENLEMGAFTRKDPRVARDIHSLMEKFPILSQRRDTLAGNLSGGEAQILAIAMGLLLEPRLMMLDEPSIGLSPQSVSLIFKIIQQISETGTTILMVEQNARRALAISRRAFVLELGKVKFSGTGEEILGNPELRKVYLGG